MNTRPRRGVLLLIVLSLLTLFVLTGVTFIVVAGQYRRGSVLQTKFERSGTPPDKLLDAAVLQLLNSPKGSVLDGHGLLEDLYGREGFAGEVSGGVNDLLSGQLLEFDFNYAPDATQEEDNFYNGCVLTFATGDAVGQSARVLEYSKSSGKIFIEPVNGTLSPGDEFYVNGRPFNGTGHGYDTENRNLRLQYYLDGDNPIPSDELEMALVPTVAARDIAAEEHPGDDDVRADEGGADESYDAPDFQNWFMAWIDQLPQDGRNIIPSFHRPAVVNFTYDRVYGGSESEEFMTHALDKITLRPSVIDNKQFSGSNIYLDPESEAFSDIENDPNQQAEFISRITLGTADIDGDGSLDAVSTWDVDNDGDGWNDSIWIDLGLPPQTEDGVTYKPLFAFLCIDLDGRINVNTAGIDGALPANGGNYTNQAAGNGFDGSTAAKGVGYGPAEIDLPAAITQSFEFFMAKYSDPDGAAPGLTNFDDSTDFPTKNIDFNLHNGLPDVLGRGVLLLDHFGQPLTDANAGLSAVFQDLDHPYELNLVARNGRDALFTDSDVERILRWPDWDAPSLPDRLSQLGDFAGNFLNSRSVTARSFDVPVGNTAVPPNRRSIEIQGADRIEITETDAFTWLKLGLAQLVLDQLGQTELPSGLWDDDPSNDPNDNEDLPDRLSKMIPFELIRGHKMNLNRQFGDGIDNNGNGIIDDPSENETLSTMALRELLNDRMEPPPDADTPLYNYNKDVAAPVRQLYARHLYCLLMLAKESAVNLGDADSLISGYFGSDPGGNGQNRTAAILAQWAINVIDFADADAIMTPFEFDMDLSDGWNVDGDLSTPDGSHRGVVWGAERPELLITETLAWHDIRTEDRDDDENGTTTTAPTNADEDFDQRLRPRGAFFVELYNPWSGDFYSQPPVSLYGEAGQGVWLNQTASSGGFRSPVWRLVVSDRTGPDEVFDDGKMVAGVPAIESGSDTRYVYFVDGDVGSDTYRPNFSTKDATRNNESRQNYSTNLYSGNILVPPNAYAVIGSPGVKATKGSRERFVSTVGFRTADRDLLSAANEEDELGMINYDRTRAVVLDRTPGSQQVAILNNYPSIPNPAPNLDPDDNDFNEADLRSFIPAPPISADLPPSVAVLINQPEEVDSRDVGVLGLTISEPLPFSDDNDYKKPERGRPGDYWRIDGGELNYEEVVYEEVSDKPFDLDRLDFGDSEIQGRFNDVVESNLPERIHSYRIVHLQRLANPKALWNPPPSSPGHQANLPINPYITIDSSAVDLTVFNGLQGETPTPPARPHNLAARQRGDDPSSGPRNLWRFEDEPHVVPPPNPSTWTEAAAEGDELAPAQNPHVYGVVMRTSLGYLNHGYHPYMRRGDSAGPEYEGAPKTSPEGAFMGKAPFPWLGWLDRPFANKLELLNVPKTSAPALMHAFPQAGTDFDHLLNFFAGSSQDPALYRLFEFVEVPPKFLGTETWYNESEVRTAFSSGTGPNYLGPGQYSMYPNFRSPGLVNINTIPSSEVWDSVTDSFADPVPYTDLELSRRGYVDDDEQGNNEQGNNGLEPELPTQFANPFRAAASADLVPVQELRPEVTGNIRQSYVGLLRPQSNNYVPGSGLQFAAQPLFTSQVTDHWQDTTRNPFFKFRDLQKLSSMVTTHSNVYAVWVTVGYFEFNDSDGNGTPDLGRELGEDTGEIKRHRAFYIIDRSIPAAYEPGVRHNEENTIVLRRMID